MATDKHHSYRQASWLQLSWQEQATWLQTGYMATDKQHGQEHTCGAIAESRAGLYNQ